MEKIMVNVYVPSLQESYDVYIPTELKITQLCSLLAEGIHSLSGGKYGVLSRRVYQLVILCDFGKYLVVQLFYFVHFKPFDLAQDM